MDIEYYKRLVRQDEIRDKKILHLTANEPCVSATTRSFLSSPLGDRYFFGAGDDEGVVDFQPSTFLGFKGVQELVEAASKSAKEMLGAADVNLSCLSGVHAMTCAILTLTKPGDTVMTLSLEQGGHFSTQSVVECTGRRHLFIPYNTATFAFDLEGIAEECHKKSVAALYLDSSFYLQPHNLKEIREAVGEEVVIIYDASHTIGLIMGGYFQDPFTDGADVICANTHKTLAGPQKGMMAFKDQKVADAANALINGGLVSSPHTAAMIGLSVAILEIQQFGRAYAGQIIKNANALGAALAAYGYTVRKTAAERYSENHQVHLITEGIGEYRALNRQLLHNSMAVHFSNVFGGDMFIRLGTQEITRRGMKENEMAQIASHIHHALNGEDCRSEVEELVHSFEGVHYSFDQELKNNG